MEVRWPGVGRATAHPIEDKVVRFSERASHQIFLEPEALPGNPGCDLVYPNGISTSLPLDVQERLVATIAGLEQARIVQGRPMRSSMIMSTRGHCCRAWRLKAIRGLFPGRTDQTAPPDMRRPRRRDLWPG